MFTTAGTTDRSIFFNAVEDVGGTNAGEPKTGLTFSNIESASYIRAGAARVAITPATLASASAAHSDGGFVEVDATNVPGLYRFDPPDAAFSTGVDEVVVYVEVAGASNAIIRPRAVQITDFDLRTANVTLAATTHTGAVIPTTTVVTDQVAADMTAISGDAVAADNLEAMYDGTGYTAESAPASRAQVDGIGAASGGAFPIEATEDNASTAIKGVSKVGTETGTFANTEADDSLYHVITHATNDIDWIYGFDIGGARTGVRIRFKGFLDSNNDAMFLQAYDFVGADWETVKEIPGQNGSTDIELDANLLLKHTGTGTDLGKIFIRFEADGAMTSPVLNVNLLHVDAINIGQSVGYALSQIWVNTLSGTAGQEPFFNGTGDKAVLTWTDALALSTSVGLTDFHIINGSTIQLSANSDNFSLFGDNWILDLNGQSIADAYFQGAHVSGVGVSTAEVHFEGCDVATASIQLGHFDFCSFDGTITHTLVGDYNYHNCYSKVAGVGGPTFTKTAGQVITAQWRNWAGSITVSGIQASDVMTISGTELGDVVLNGAEGTVKILGIYESLTDNRTGSPTLVLGAYEGSDITDMPASVWDRVISMTNHNIGQSAGKILRQSGDLVQIDGAVSDVSPTTTGFDTNLTQVDTYWDDAVLIFTNGAANAGKGHAITSYLNTNGAVIFDADDAWAVTPVNGDDFVIFANHVHPVSEIAGAVWDEILTAATHNISTSAGRRLRTVPMTIIREDTAQGAGTGNNQIQFDTGASAVDGTYDPALVFIAEGTGIGQSRNILQYDGTTKTATVDRNWKVNPDATSGFIIQGDAGREHVNEGLAQAGTSNTITLNTLASSITNAYVGQIVFIRSGTGDDQVGTVIAYNGTTKVATLDRNWGTVPDTTSGYVMVPASPVELTDNSIDNILDESLSGHTTAGTLGKVVSDIETRTLSAADVAKLSASVGTIVSAVAQTGTLSSTQMTSDLSEATNDHYIGRIILWTSGALTNQATDITDYAGASGLLTFTEVTDIPANNDTFIIV